MRRTCGVLVVLGLVAVAGQVGADEGVRAVGLVHRYGIEVDLKRYPQSDPKETIRSVIKATQAGQIDYMLAHLISPSQVDQKFRGDTQALKALAAKATPAKSKQMVDALKQQLQQGAWTIRETTAYARASGVPDLSLEKIGDHWFMHNTPTKRPTR
ncbi:MAG: hypothetical protein JW818_07580 [Pirellulales bacterium]|nr:hypothetical protein [Pirellulales bacterium]